MIIQYQEEKQIRIDLFLANYNETSFSRSFIQKLIKSGFIKVDDQVINKQGFLIKKNMIISVDDESYFSLKKINLVPWENSNIINIIEETDDYIILDKPSGIVTHPAIGNWDKTLVNALIFEFETLDFQFKTRPGIIHRLDKDTSGLMIISKNQKFTNWIQLQFKNREVHKTYLAFCEGKLMKSKGLINAPIGRSRKDFKKQDINGLNPKNSQTEFQIMNIYENFSLIKFMPSTGRTHQIRIHSKYIGHPILNDSVYGKVIPEFESYGQFLHAWKLSFKDLSNKVVNYESSIPLEFKKIDKEIESKLKEV